MPLFLIKDLKDGARLSIWKIDENERELRSLLSLFPEEQNELDMMRSKKSRTGHLAARVALKQLLPTTEPVLSLKDHQGKPYLPHLPGYISLSHSGVFGVAMMHGVHPVGIDIEAINLKIKKIAPKFLKKQERDWVCGPDSVEMMYVCWCLKESAFKWYGKKGISLKDNMTIERFTFGTSSPLKLRLDDHGRIFDLSFGYEKIEGYMLAYILND